MKTYERVRKEYGNPGEPEAFIKWVVAAMGAHGISQGALARRSGFSPSHVSDWLRLKVIPQIGTLLVLHEALDQLLEDKEGA